MRMNVRLVRTFQFLHQFRLIVWHKLGKEQIIPDALNRLVIVNNAGYNALYLELNALFVYYTSLVKINPEFVRHILEGYATDD